MGDAVPAAPAVSPRISAAKPTKAQAQALAKAPAQAVLGGRFGGLHALLFGIYPVLFLWSQNVGEVGPDDVGDALVLTFLVVLLATALTWLVFRDRRRAALIVAPAALGFLLYGHIAKLGVQSDIETGAWLASVMAALVAAIRLSSRWLARVDASLTSIASVLVLVSLVTIVPPEVDDALTSQPVVVAGRTLSAVTSAQKRDVYWLVFDRYGSDRSFKLQFGVDNELTPWLREKGFDVLPDSHANYVATALSMSTTLNMRPLKDLVRGVPDTSGSYAPTYRALQSSPVVRQFQALGYRYFHLGSWWNATRTDEAADKNYNADGVSDFTSVLLETSVIPEAVDALGLEGDLTPPTESAKHLKHNTYALDTLDDIAPQAGPKFVLAHVLLPHPPYIFDRDGRYIAPDEAATLDPKDAWNRQLDYTNSRLREFLGGLLAVPEARRPIIILQADEGPWPDRYAKDQFNFNWDMATTAELETKFGIMNAWYVPGQDLNLPRTLTAINTFPVLFDRYFGLAYPLLTEEIYASRGWRRPYQLIDVTDELPSLR